MSPEHEAYVSSRLAREVCAASYDSAVIRCQISLKDTPYHHLTEEFHAFINELKKSAQAAKGDESLSDYVFILNKMTRVLQDSNVEDMSEIFDIAQFGLSGLDQEKERDALIKKYPEWRQAMMEGRAEYPRQVELPEKGPLQNEQSQGTL